MLHLKIGFELSSFFKIYAKEIIVFEIFIDLVQKIYNLQNLSSYCHTKCAQNNSAPFAFVYKTKIFKKKLF